MSKFVSVLWVLILFKEKQKATVAEHVLALSLTEKSQQLNFDFVKRAAARSLTLLIILSLM